MRAAEVCPHCGRSSGDYWILPRSWLWIPELPKMTPDELVDYLAERRMREREEAFAKEHADGY